MSYILLVDDDEDVRDVVQMVLSRRGWEVATAAGGAEALERLDSRAPPALILLDLRMPGMSGSELVEAMREKAGLRDVPVVVLSGDGSASEMVRRLGVQAFIPKPMELSELIEAVDRFAVGAAG